MDTQLRLLPGDGPDPRRTPDWHLDDDTRRLGLRGVALARQALQAHRPRPETHADDDAAAPRRHDPAA